MTETPRFEMTTCSECDGLGWISDPDSRDYLLADPCWRCNHGEIKRRGIPLTLDLREAYR